MIFNSFQFVIFILVFLFLYSFTVKNLFVRNVVVLVGSYLFYAAWYWEYSALILMSTVVDYFAAHGIAKANYKLRKKILLCVSLGFNLGLLFLFKYFNFFKDNFNSAVTSLGLEASFSDLELLLPVGISFYTFQTMSYTIDVYRGNISPEKSFIRFAAYVSFFPQLVAGPIVRAKQFLPQLAVLNRATSVQVNTGMMLIFVGLFKKIVIADLLAYYIVDSVFSNPGLYSSADLMVSLYAYTFQIYCDFSGYSDIAIGVALLLGFELPRNFNKPYLSQNPSEFWRRWHITLSEWLRDYLYIPLGGGRGSKLKIARNLSITMLLGGLWHGAAWNYVLWGAYHGLLLVVFRTKTDSKSNSLIKYINIFFMFHLVVFSWLLFRVPDMYTFQQYIEGLARGTTDFSFAAIGYCILIFAVITHAINFDNIVQICNRLAVTYRLIFTSIIYLFLTILLVGATVSDTAFVYFQF